MPSQSRKLFRDKLVPDVANLVDTHRKLNPGGHGRRALGHITRSGVLMLSAAWELYIEEVLVEGVIFLVEAADSPDFLPDGVKGKIAQVAKNDKHAFGALKLCGLGWRTVYADAVRKDCENFNTPKFGNIAKLYSDWLNVDQGSFQNSWRHPPSEINEFITLRGEIAHRGADARYVQIKKLTQLKMLVDDLVVDTDRFLSDHLKDLCNRNRRPWRR